jgi:phage repressor protein C with HTH and peptisase S24 domain
MAATANISSPTKKKTVKAAPATGSSKTRAAAKTTAKQKPAATATSNRTAAARKPRTTSAKTNRVDTEQRRNYIEVAAYYIAERRGFIGGNEADDWAAAEIEIDRLLSEGKLNR